MSDGLKPMARRLRDATRVNPQAVRNGARMYKEARQILSAGISFNKAANEHALAVRLRELEQRMKEQIKESCRTAPSIREIDRRAAKIAALYKDALDEIKKEIDQLTNDNFTDGGSVV